MSAQKCITCKWNMLPKAAQYNPKQPCRPKQIIHTLDTCWLTNLEHTNNHQKYCMIHTMNLHTLRLISTVILEYLSTGSSNLHKNQHRRPQTWNKACNMTTMHLQDLEHKIINKKGLPTKLLYTLSDVPFFSLDLTEPQSIFRYEWIMNHRLDIWL